MKFSNDSIIDDEIDKNDTTNALISNDDLLKFFNLERDNVQKILITHKKDGVYVNITLNQSYCQCPVCGNMTNRVKDYKDKKITHSILTVTSCYIIYHARRYQCIHCKKAFYENNPFTFGGWLSVVTVSNVLRDLKSPNATFTDVARRYDISITTAINLFDRHVHISRIQLPECLVLDEVYAFKSHDSDYIRVIVDYLDKKIIDVLPSRHKNVLINYFMLIPREEREKWYYVKKKYQLNWNISSSLTVFCIIFFILIWTLIITVTMCSHCIVKCLNIFKYQLICFIIILNFVLV